MAPARSRPAGWGLLVAVGCGAFAPVSRAAEPCTPPGWASPAVMTSAVLTPGQAVVAPLAPAAALHLPQAARAAPPGSFGAVLTFDTDRPARWRVLLSGKAWIDVIDGETPVASAAHRHGPECGPVRKMVDFDLAPGRHLIALSGAPGPSLVVEVQSAR